MCLTSHEVLTHFGSIPNVVQCMLSSNKLMWLISLIGNITSCIYMWLSYHESFLHILEVFHVWCNACLASIYLMWPCLVCNMNVILICLKLVLSHHVYDKFLSLHSYGKLCVWLSISFITQAIVMTCNKLLWLRLVWNLWQSFHYSDLAEPRGYTGGTLVRVPPGSPDLLKVFL